LEPLVARCRGARIGCYVADLVGHSPQLLEPFAERLVRYSLRCQSAFNPFRLDRSEAVTCDQNHDYTPEQQAYDNFAMDKFIEFTGVDGPGCPDLGLGVKVTMGYYDGNTVTALWNYAH
jgi:phospholipase C